MFRKKGDIMNYYDEIKNILVDNAIGRKVREYKSNQKDLESYYNVGKLLVEAQGEKKGLSMVMVSLKSILRDLQVNLEKDIL